jgi:hypothetical protein
MHFNPSQWGPKLSHILQHMRSPSPAFCQRVPIIITVARFCYFVVLILVDFDFDVTQLYKGEQILSLSPCSLERAFCRVSVCLSTRFLPCVSVCQKTFKRFLYKNVCNV